MSACLPHNYRAPRWLPSERLQTCRGIVIGGAIAPPVPTMTVDGERIQAALLDPRTARPRRRIAPLLLALWGWLAAIGLCAAAALVQMP